MSNLQKMTEELESVSTTANMNLDDIPSNTRGGWSASIAAAKERLPGVQARYKDSLLQNAVAIFVSGDKAKVAEFTSLIRSENEGLVVDANALYDRLARDVTMTLPDNRGIEWGITQTHKLHLSLQEVMHEVGLRELPMPSNGTAPFVNGYDDVLENVKGLMRAAVGGTLNKLYLEKDLIGEAMKIRYTSSMVPVIVTGADQAEIYDLSRVFGRGSTDVAIPDGTLVDKEFLVKTFKEINKKLKNKKNATEDTVTANPATETVNNKE